MASEANSRIVFFIDPDEMDNMREEVTIVGSPVIPRIRVSSVGDDRLLSGVSSRTKSRGSQCITLWQPFSLVMFK